MSRMSSSWARVGGVVVAAGMSVGCAGPGSNAASSSLPPEGVNATRPAQAASGASAGRSQKPSVEQGPADSPLGSGPQALLGGKEALDSRASVDSPTAPKEQHIPLLHPPKEHPWLGVELQATDGKRPGVRIQRVVPGSPAEAASLRAGDILLEIDGRPTSSPEQLAKTVKSQPVNEEVPLLLDREGQMHLLRIALPAMPEFEDRLRLAFIGRPAPAIDGVMTFQGEAASLRDFHGQVLVLEFWASFCGVCRMMGPLLDRWDERYRALGGHVMGITVDPPDVGARVARSAQMGYTLASDPDSTVTRDYWASQIPTLFIIDRSGTVRDVMVGYSEHRLAQFESLVELLLEQPPP